MEALFWVLIALFIVAVWIFFGTKAFLFGALIATVVGLLISDKEEKDEV